MALTVIALLFIACTTPSSDLNKIEDKKLQPPVVSAKPKTDVKPQPIARVETAAVIQPPKPVAVERPPEPQVRVEPVISKACDRYRDYFAEYNWNARLMMAICQAESGGDSNAVSPLNYDGLRDYGLMQIHGEAIFDPAANIARAYQKYASQGLRAWSTYTNGKYLAYY